MKHAILLLSLLFSFLHNYAQDYSKYYNLCYQAEKYMYLEKYDSALINFNNAMKHVDYMHSDYLSKASFCALKLGDLNTTYEFVLKAIKNGAEPSFIETDEYKKYRKTKNFKAFKDSLNIYSEKYLLRLNTNYILLIDSLYFIDQAILRGNYSFKGEYNLSTFELPTNRYLLDSTNFDFLLHLIDKWGFPSEQIVGKKSAFKANIILHHNLRKPQNHDKLIEFKQYLYTGEYSPKFYGWTYDQSFFFYGKKPKIYYEYPKAVNLTPKEKIEIDSIRSELLIESLELEKLYGKGIFRKQ